MGNEHMPSNAGNNRSISENFIDASWMQRGLDALKETLDVSPGLKKQMVEFLFDSNLWDESKLTWDAAIAKFDLQSVPKDWFQSVKRFVGTLGVHVCVGAMEASVLKVHWSDDKAFRYFCGICWKKSRELQ